MKTKKLWTTLALAAATLFLVAGCGSSGSKGNSGSDDNQDALAAIKEAGELKIATSPDFPPMEFYILQDGQKEIVGSDISLAQAIADEIGVKLVIKATDFSGVLANIQAGEVDMGISGFAQTKAREEIMDFSDGYDQSVSDEYQGLLVSKETAAKYQTLDAFKEAKLKIGAQSGSIQYELAQTLTSDANIKQYGTTDAAFLALSSGDLDGVVVSTGSAKPILSTFPDLEILPKETFDLDPDGFYNKNVIGLPKTKDNATLLEVVNKVIQDSKDSGDYEKWYNDALAQSKNAIDEEND